MKWKIVRANDDDAEALTNGELIGLSILAANYAGEPHDAEVNVYWRAWEKIQPQVEEALASDE